MGYELEKLSSYFTQHILSHLFGCYRLAPSCFLTTGDLAGLFSKILFQFCWVPMEKGNSLIQYLNKERWKNGKIPENIEFDELYNI